MANKTEVVTTGSMDVVLYDHELFPELKWADPQEFEARSADRFKRATSLDDLFDVMTGNNSQALVGRRLEIRAVDFQAYQADDGVIPNAICQAADIDSGEVLEFSTTSGFCTKFLRMAELLGQLPVRVKITDTLTKSGQKALNFERP
jgi:hypothetical protein